MKKLFPDMCDSPEKPQIILGLFYCVVSFFSLPFILTLLKFIEGNTTQQQYTYELIFHIINFLAAVILFRGYLADSFLQVQIAPRKVLGTAGLGLLMSAVWVLLAVAGYFLLRSYYSYVTVFYALPIMELDVFTFSRDLVQNMPLWGILCSVLAAPVTISCLFYATSFAPTANRKPLPAYPVVALVILFPRLCNAFTFHDLPVELLLYLAQLPIHLIACWTYQKTDTVWAPIFTLSAANLLFSIAAVILF